jgi:hypothetical protein
LHDDVERIETREDLAAFVESLRLDYEQDPTKWANDDVSTYLEALASPTRGYSPEASGLAGSFYV